MHINLVIRPCVCTDQFFIRPLNCFSGKYGCGLVGLFADLAEPAIIGALAHKEYFLLGSRRVFTHMGGPEK